MLIIFLKAFVNPELQDLKLAFATNIGTDYHYIDFYESIVKPYLNESFDFADLIDNMFPKNSFIDNDTYFSTIKMIIRETLPQEIREKTLEYVQQFILPKVS